MGMPFDNLIQIVFIKNNKEEKKMVEKDLFSSEVLEEKVNCIKCADKTKKRDEKEYKALLKRLCIIEGQVRGVKKMLEEDRYCVDIITQASAVAAAINSFNKTIMADHIKTCVVDEIKNGNEEVIDELLATFKNLMK